MRSFVESSDDIVISQMMFLPSVIALIARRLAM